MDIQSKKDKRIGFEESNNQVRDISVAFISERLKQDYELLKQGKFQDRQLYKSIEKIIDDLKKDPTSGTKVHKRLWPREYRKKYEITNLWKCNLPNAWRLLYIQ